ncbi:MAG: hypothetical protein JST47_10410 [Bacteroidetes bacterium]|nr:hypothetical protein [Bacteroidota bacterium]MBS1975069.1 hypothetical protein [Bacteroidota bacterium]
MKAVNFFPAIILAVISFTSCNSNSSNSSTQNESTVPAANTSIATGDEGSYTFTVAGKKVDEKGTLMDGFKANLNTDDGGVLSLVLTNASAEDGSVSSFLFGIPNKTGSSTFTKENDKVNDTAYMCTYTGGPNHGSDTKIDPHVNSITINVENLSDKRVSGTFSGSVIGEDGSSILPVTDGKFDLPIFKLGSH